MYDIDGVGRVRQPGSGCLLTLWSRSSSPETPGIPESRPATTAIYIFARCVFILLLIFLYWL